MSNYLKTIEVGIITLLLVLFCTKTHAQYDVSIESASLNGPIHPLGNFGKPRLNTNIEKINYYYYFNYIVGGEFDEPLEKSSYFRRSEDQLTDTLFNYMSLSFINRYDEKGRLIYERQYDIWYPLNEYVRTDYEYDEAGRVVKEIQTSIRPSANPSEKPTEKVLQERIYDYSTVQKTEKGYIFENIEYEFDDKGRLACKIFYNYGGDEFVKYKDGKEYRKNASYYSYTDNSYTEFVYSAMDNLLIQGMPDCWLENKFVFNEQGNAIWQTLLVSEDGVNWMLRGKMKAEYVYSTGSRSVDRGTESYNSSAGKTKTIVTAHAGEIQISTGNRTTVQIFDITGRIVKQQALPAGESRVSMSSGGFYIVRVGNESFKVSVR